jgi:copper chaperone NosL
VHTPVKRILNFVFTFPFLFLILLLVSCKGGNQEQLPVDFVWDRVACEECKMAISDPHYSAQVINPEGIAFYFDDIGCAILWLSRQSWKDKSRTWVNDLKTTEWIEAKKANWIYGDPKTPMGYGYAATLSPIEKQLDYKTVQKWMLIGKNLVNENMVKHLNDSSEQTRVGKQAVPSSGVKAESQIPLEDKSDEKTK